MLFMIPDETGRITQANKVYDPTGYGERLHDAGLKFVAMDHPGVLSPDEWHIPDGVLTARPMMAIAIDRVRIKAGGTDAAVLTGAPKDVTFSVSVGDSLVWSGTLPDGELELSVPTPGVYRIALTKWPYQDFAITVEAVQ